MLIDFGLSVVDQSHTLMIPSTASSLPSNVPILSSSSGTRLIMTVPNHSDLVSITGALIVFSFISSCVILTYIINGFNLLWDKMIHGELVPDSKSVLSSFITFAFGLTFYLINEISTLYINLKTGLTSWIRWKSKSSRWPIATTPLFKKRV